MDSNNKNFSYLENNEEHRNFLRSSRMPNARIATNVKSTAMTSNFGEETSLKKIAGPGRFLPNKFLAEDSAGVDTQRKLVLVTPIRGEHVEEVNSKQTVVGSNLNFSLNFFGQKKSHFLESSASGDDNKENSNISNIDSRSRRDLFSSGSVDREDRIIGDSFKIPNKKTNFTEARNLFNSVSSVRVNLQSSFNHTKGYKGVNIFDSKMRENNPNLANLTNTLISSGSSSSSQLSQGSAMKASQESSRSNENENESLQLMQISQNDASQNESMIISREGEKENSSKVQAIVKNPFTDFKNNNKEKTNSFANINPFPNNNSINPFNSLPIPQNKNNENNCIQIINPFTSSQNESSSYQNSQQTVTESLLDGFEKKANFFIPAERSHDEKFKLLALRKVRKFQFKDNKSISNAEIKNSEGCPAEDCTMNYEPQSTIDYDLFTMKRKKVAHSVKRIYASEIQFTDPLTQVKRNFKIFKDGEIGFGDHWQKFLHTSAGDEDVPSDDELLIRAKKHTLDHLWEAMNTVFTRKEFDKISNLHLLQKEEEGK